MDREGLLLQRAECAATLIDAITAHAESSAKRVEEWARAFDAQRFGGDNITTIRAACDHHVWHLDAEIVRLKGDIDATRVAIENLDAQLRG